MKKQNIKIKKKYGNSAVLSYKPEVEINLSNILTVIESILRYLFVTYNITLYFYWFFSIVFDRVDVQYNHVPAWGRMYKDQST